MLLRAGVERLLLLVFWAARGVFILQGVAFGLASVTVFAVASAGMPSWLRATFVSSVTISGTFFVAGFLLIVERRWRVRSSGAANSQPMWPWPLVLGLSLLVLPAVAVIAASGLPALWSQIGTQLAAIGFWEGLTKPDNSGMVMLPLFLALFVPALVTAAAVYSVAFPLAILPLLVTRSPLFPTLLAMGATCQAALVLNGWIASGALVRVVSAAISTMNGSGDAEVMRLAGELEREAAIVSQAAAALVVPTLGVLAWFAFLRPSGATALYFADDLDAAPAEHSDVTLAGPAGPRPWTPGVTARQRVARQDVANQRPGPGVLALLARLGLAALGALMLLFGVADGLRTRALYVTSQPAPGATLMAGPTAVRATFGAELDPASSLSVTRLVLEPAAGNGPQDMDVMSRLAPHDPKRRTLEAVSSALPVGLYRVSWRALPAGGGVSRHGSYSFGVGVSVPADTTGMAHSLQERDAGSRGRRQVLFGGVLLLVLGALLPWLSPRWNA